jgi:cytoskeleton protein RodZ
MSLGSTVRGLHHDFHLEASRMDVGGELRRARTARNRSIEDVARTTKINASLLREIEANAFDRLAGGVFTRGYLRAYGREVGLDPEELVRAYRAMYEAPPAVETADKPLQDAGEPRRPQRLTLADDPPERKHRQIIEFAVILLIVAVCFAFLKQPKSKPPATVASPAPTETAPPAVANKSVATSGSTDGVPAEVTLDIRPQGPCWIEATSGGKRVVARLMDAGDQQSVTIREDLTLRIGEPAVFAFTIDGVPGRSLGVGGKPITVQITLQNYKTFLQPRQ